MPETVACTNCIGIAEHYHAASGAPVMFDWNGILREMRAFPQNFENSLFSTAYYNKPRIDFRTQTQVEEKRAQKKLFAINGR